MEESREVLLIDIGIGSCGYAVIDSASVEFEIQKTDWEQTEQVD